MKKIISLVFAIIMAMSLCVPAFAVERDPKTDELYETFTFDFDLAGWQITTVETENFMLETCVPAWTAVCGGDENYYTNIWVKEGKKATITRIEARVLGYEYQYAGVGVTAGTKRENTNVKKGTWVHVDDINSSEFSFNGGTGHSEFDIIKVYYTCDEHYWGNDGYCELCGAFICDTDGHTWKDDGYCKYCGVFKCDVTGEHTWDDNGHCKYCSELLCSGSGEHNWGETGHCTYCEALKCNVTGVHDHTTETQIPAYIVKHTCDYCGETISEEVVEADNNTASVFAEGNAIIVLASACIIFGAGGYFIGRGKKKEN